MSCRLLVNFHTVSIKEQNVFINIFPSPLTDHRAIYIAIKLISKDNRYNRANYWNFNKTLLKYEVKQNLSVSITFL